MFFSVTLMRSTCNVHLVPSFYLNTFTQATTIFYFIYNIMQLQEINTFRYSNSKLAVARPVKTFFNTSSHTMVHYRAHESQILLSVLLQIN
jgi:hypothetical protein